MKTAVKVLVWAALLAGAAAMSIGAGLYNVAADQPHWPVTERLLQTVRERSVKARANDIGPPNLADPRMIAAGARNYDEMCVMCHLAPGVAETAIRQGLNPKPPDLSREEIDPRAAFWIIKHGIKATGMPSWGASHNDAELWELVAFVAQLPSMDADRYRQLAGTSERRNGHR